MDMCTKTHIQTHETNTHVHTYIHIYTHICIQINMYTCPHTYIMYVHTKCTCVLTHTKPMHVHVYADLHRSMHTYMYPCTIRTCMHEQVYTHIHKHTYTHIEILT